MLEHKGTFSASSSDNAKKNLDAAFIHHTGGVYGKLEQVGLQMIINLTHTCVNSKDWKEIHDYIIYENNLDNIPNRQISVVSELAFSPKRSVYSMSEDEADV